MKNLAIVVLAAGKGKRMKSGDLPKVLIPLREKPLLGHVLENLEDIKPEKIILVVGHLKDKVKDYARKLNDDKITFADQDEQLGTGHAVMQAEDELENFEGDVLILAGDVPLLTTKTLDRFISEHKKNNADVSVLSTTAPDPDGYGRIVRDKEGNFTKITEHKDADEDTKKIDEINSGIFLVEKNTLVNSLKNVSNKNAQGEYYLTDIVDILKSKDKPVFAFNLADFKELQGVNSPEDLKRAEKVYLEMK